MVIGAMLVVLAVSGYFMGLRQTGSYVSLTHSGITPAGPAHHEDPTLAVPTIVSYPQLDRDAVGPNADFVRDLWMLF